MRRKKSNNGIRRRFLWVRYVATAEFFFIITTRD